MEINQASSNIFVATYLVSRRLHERPRVVGVALPKPHRMHIACHPRGRTSISTRHPLLQIGPEAIGSRAKLIGKSTSHDLLGV